MSYTCLQEAGGGILGGMLLGHSCVCAVEIEPYRRNNLLQRQRDGIFKPFPIWNNICTFNGRDWAGKVRAVCGGFPCQDISVAGNGCGIEGVQSGLWKEMARVVREVGPRYAFVENAAALVVRGLGSVLRDLAEMGYNAQWGVFRAADVGAPHKRERIFILADADKERFQRRVTQSVTRFVSVDYMVAGECFPRKLYDLPKPTVLGNGHGLADYVDRIQAIGDGQVPRMAAFAWKVLSA